MISCTRKKIKKTSEKWEKLEDKDLVNLEVWRGVFQKIARESEKIVLINTLGTAVALRGQSLEDINEKPIIAAIEALKVVNVQKSIGHISSRIGWSTRGSLP